MDYGIYRELLKFVNNAQIETTFFKMCLFAGCLVEGGGLLSPPGDLAIAASDPPSLRQMSCSRDDENDYLEWAEDLDRNNVFEPVWSTNNPATTSNEDLWSVTFVDNVATLTVEAVPETDGEYMCIYGGTSSRKVNVMVVGEDTLI